MNIYKLPPLSLKLLSYFGKNFPKTLISLRQLIRHKTLINWSHPRSMQEYIYKQLFDKATDINFFGMAADKYEVREYIKEKIGEQFLNDIYGVWENANDIDFSSLPNNFVLKTNNGCGTNFFVSNKKELDIPSTIAMLNHWLETPYGNATGQIHYSTIKPLIIAEKFLKQTKKITTNELIDYKFYCINGKPVNVLVCTNRSERSHLFDAMIYDMNWTEQPEYIAPGYSHIKGLAQPESFQEMKQLVTKLAEPFKFVRIDFYEIDGKPIFGEITLTPSMDGALSKYGDTKLIKQLL